MNVALWIVQALLALAFLLAGGMKLATPIDDLVANGMAFAEHVPYLVRFIGLSEVAGALGLILPMALNIKPKLTPIAAGALAFVMVLAAATHVMLGDFAGLGAPVMLGSLAAFVAWGRGAKRTLAAPELAGAR